MSTGVSGIPMREKASVATAVAISALSTGTTLQSKMITEAPRQRLLSAQRQPPAACRIADKQRNRMRAATAGHGAARVVLLSFADGLGKDWGIHARRAICFRPRRYRTCLAAVARPKGS